MDFEIKMYLFKNISPPPLPFSIYLYSLSPLSFSTLPLSFFHCLSPYFLMCLSFSFTPFLLSFLSPSLPFFVLLRLYTVEINIEIFLAMRMDNTHAITSIFSSLKKAMKKWQTELLCLNIRNK